MSDGVICNVACGVAAAFDGFASPAQPLNAAAPHATIASIAIVPQARCLLATERSTLILVPA
jgi:hypothetical protein